ncbi:alpha/beta fold hydrolase [Ammoniphilus sp. CFH 90114]|uniref:alpha/beta fold hydrolase n=1 Tax=Ammoniphilus sp. CFH 90114 TaxID=2493665 RepID=UPI0013E92115|nr:alpha/beta hydrolase [Ammoniphilus sp. CFH 90114]
MKTTITQLHQSQQSKLIWKGNFIKIDGVRIHYVEKGKGSPLLLVHGLGAYSFTWRHNLDELAKQFRVIAVDLKGFGFSEKPVGPGYSIDHHVKIMASFISQLGLGQVDYVGSSMGGEIGLRLCLKHPDLIRKLILVGSSGYRDRLPLWVKMLGHLPYKSFIKTYIQSKYLRVEVLAEMFKGAYHDPNVLSDEEIKQYLSPIYTQGFEESYLTMLREFDFGKCKDQYDQVTHSSLILAAEHDLVIPMEHSKQLHRDLPQSEFIVLPKCGHFLHEEKSQETNQLILEFLH